MTTVNTALERGAHLLGDAMEDMIFRALPAIAWRSIPSCPGYDASSEGRIRNHTSGNTLVGELDKYGYRRVNLTVGGETVKRRVHRLVCEAFNGPAPSSEHHAAHTNGISTDNRPANLRWATPAENNADKRLHGTHQAGIKSPRAKLTEAQVAEIRSSTGSARQTAARFGIAASQVVRIRNGQRWAAASSCQHGIPNAEKRK